MNSPSLISCVHGASPVVCTEAEMVVEADISRPRNSRPQPAASNSCRDAYGVSRYRRGARSTRLSISGSATINYPPRARTAAWNASPRAP